MLRLYPAPLNNQKIFESPQKIFRLVIPAAGPHDGEPGGVDERHGHVVLEHGEPEQQQQHEIQQHEIQHHRQQHLQHQDGHGQGVLRHRQPRQNMWGKKPIRWTLNHSRKLVGK